MIIQVKIFQKKNKHFGTLSSHYWIWKNRLELLKENDWIGINHYRRFWIKEKNSDILTANLNENLLRYIPDDCDFDILLPEKIYIKNLKLSKVLKKGFRNYIRKPDILFNRSKISINLHFDLFHGYSLLDQAAGLLDEDDVLDIVF